MIAEVGLIVVGRFFTVGSSAIENWFGPLSSVNPEVVLSFLISLFLFTRSFE